MNALPDPEEGLEISPEKVAELAPRIAAEELVLVDCREAEEWEFNRLPGARWVPLSRFVEMAEAVVADAKPAIVYCHHGMRSQRATAWLRARGLESSWSMAGGIDAWSARIDPSVPTY